MTVGGSVTMALQTLVGVLMGSKKRIVDVQPKALFVHCSAHSLNLVVQDSFQKIPAVRDFLAIIRDLINFVRGSPKRLAAFEKLQSDEAETKIKILEYIGQKLTRPEKSMVFLNLSYRVLIKCQENTTKELQRIHTNLMKICIGAYFMKSWIRVSEHICKIEEFALGKFDCNYVTDFYGYDFDQQKLLLHRDMFIDIFKSKNIPLEHMEDIINGKYVTEVVGPLHFTSNRQRTHVNLLMISDNDENLYYCLIKNLLRLVSKQKSNHNGTLHICDGCLISFRTPRHLQDHKNNDCNHLYTNIPTIDLKLNKRGETAPENKLKFINFERRLPVPFVIYADFESRLKQINRSEPRSNQPFTMRVAEHEPYSYAFYVKCNFDYRYSKMGIYKESDAPQVFTEKLDKTVMDIYHNKLKHVKVTTPLTVEEDREFEIATHCHICEKPFTADDFFFHNLSNYESKLFIRKLACPQETVFKPDTYLKIKFLDSLRFLPKSLASLSKTLESDQCIETRKHFQDEEQFSLVIQKGVFPYTYKRNNYHKKEIFYNDLASESISDKGYERANKVWNTFKCGTLGEYSDMYLKSDVLLLADVFQNFRKVCLDQYKLDPAHYLTAPSLSWDAMLLYTYLNRT
ncbi:hypothetical protein NQ315_003368 [Exocentrus adspersus]|uniref:DNA-directed DNA polymerase n=1 Tax=Exocentrus adspersus TaxID=1586481 RepID=A0AAV8VAP1_9CUCU|nr:hypothetical protein NQ315_003368 [Exocentrus adspersus]